MSRKVFFPLLASFLFFLFGLLTLSHYGVNWDSSNHYTRGQALVHYLFTGRKTYNENDLLNTNTGRLSYYRTKEREAEFFFKEKYSAHPPLPDILASLSNLVFYQKLDWLGDVESYHLFIIFLSSLLIWVVFKFTQESYGSFAAIIATLSLVLYPLFTAESHFNIKDPVVTAFYALTIYTFYHGVTQKSWKWFLASSFFCGCAFGTKWNIIFLPLILLPWLSIHFLPQIKKFKFKIFSQILKVDQKIFITLILYPLIVFCLFLLFDPLLWPNPISRTIEVFRWYQKNGESGINYQPGSFYFYGFNLYPFLTVLYTTPLVTLFFSLIGIITSFFIFRKEKDKTSLLILLWFLLPVIRVTLPGSSIYGGLRQIMEYIPAMAILAGLGAETLRKKLSLVIGHWSLVILLTAFIPITLKLIQIHPNENVYFNPLIGGLKGAKERNYPEWGVNMGSVYRQGVEWLNQNAQPNAKLALLVSTRVVLPEMFLRPDISFANNNWSRKERKGEYLMEAIYDGWIRVYYYAGEFGEKFLKPVHEIQVDGVSILKIWKNDPEHTYPQYLQEKIMAPELIKWEQTDKVLSIELPQQAKLMEIGLEYESNDCFPFDKTWILLSSNNQSWTRLKEPIKEEYLFKKGELIYPLTGVEGQYVKIKTSLTNPCPFRVIKINIHIL